MTVQDTPDTPIRPADINTKQHFWDAFNNRETEISANWIVRFCQVRGRGWEPLSLRELQAYYSRGRGREETFVFNRLTTAGYVRVDGDRVVLTAGFVRACYVASPASQG